MTVYADVLVIVNLYVDFFLLWATRRVLQLRAKPWRLAAGALTPYSHGQRGIQCGDYAVPGERRCPAADYAALQRRGVYFPAGGILPGCGFAVCGGEWGRGVCEVEKESGHCDRSLFYAGSRT